MKYTMSKLSLYNLCSQYQKLPDINDTHFQQMLDKPIWQLKFIDTYKFLHTMTIFCRQLDESTIVDEWRDKKGARHDEVYFTRIDELRGLGIIND